MVSLIPVLGLLAGPAAVMLGIAGLRRVRRDPRVRGTAHAVVAIVVGGLTTLFYWVIAILAILSVR